MTRRTSFVAPIAALETAADSLANGDRDAIALIRRIVARIQDAALASGVADIADAAKDVLAANQLFEHPAVLTRLIDVMKIEAATVEKQNASILMVEDDKVTATVLSEALIDDGFQVTIVDNAADAEKALGENEISLVLLDLVLPGSDGRDLLVKMRAQNEALPIIVITAKADAATHSECFILGADGVLLKPIHPDVLRAAVIARLQQARERHAESRVDGLTGLPNRAAFFEALDRVLAAAGQADRAMSVAMIDIDHFKSVNDQYGHGMGDVVLQRCAQSLLQSLRISDIVARWGGEEFCVFLPGTTVAGAHTALEKSLQAVRGLGFHAPGRASFGVTFSAGVAPLLPGTAARSALAQADQLLYLAKASGRNRVLTPEDASRPPRPRLLLVEDDLPVADYVISILTREGFMVQHVTDAEMALQEMSGDGLVAMVIDVGLPGMDGFELLARVRLLKPAASLPIVMLTGWSSEADIVRAFELGVNDYVVKPFNSAELIARLRRLLNRR